MRGFEHFFHRCGQLRNSAEFLLVIHCLFKQQISTDDRRGLQKLEDELFSLLKSLFFCKICFGKNLGDAVGWGMVSIDRKEQFCLCLSFILFLSVTLFQKAGDERCEDV